MAASMRAVMTVNMHPPKAASARPAWVLGPSMKYVIPVQPKNVMARPVKWTHIGKERGLFIETPVD
jgi:hypothetical protein